MDKVYSEASAILIAVAGQKLSHGLPEAGYTARDPQYSATIGGTRLIWTFGDPRLQSTRSRWSRRGWTYQECLLSRRCIYFIEQRVYYECRSMHQCESLCVPYWPSRPTDKDNYIQRQVWRRRGIFLRDTEWDMSHFLGLLSAYCERELTYDSDILKAFLGVLGLYRVSEEGFRHFYGVPLLQPAVRDHDNTRPNRRLFF